MRDMKALADSMFVAFKDYLSAAIKPLSDRLDAFERAIAEIPPGPPGERGADGINGKDGADGQRGEKGEKGDAGRDGEAGPPGPRGEAGPSGEKGADGLNGKDGEAGRDGRDGREGKDGADGRDAADLVILQGIDESRSYPRGTFASYHGGLVKAFRNTDPVSDGIQAAGWAVIVDGIAGATVSQLEDGRSFEITMSSTSGTLTKSAVTLPVMIYRSIYKPDTEYQVGDTVTWDGSLWHCERATTGQPKLSPDWRLCAKRGSDGKPGRDGKNGERGPEGPKGKDYTQLRQDGGKY